MAEQLTETVRGALAAAGVSASEADIARVAAFLATLTASAAAAPPLSAEPQLVQRVTPWERN